MRIGQEQSIERSVPLREDGRRFAPAQARMTALAIEGDKALMLILNGVMVGLTGLLLGLACFAAQWVLKYLRRITNAVEKADYLRKQ